MSSKKHHKNTSINTATKVSTSDRTRPETRIKTATPPPTRRSSSVISQVGSPQSPLPPTRGEAAHSWTRAIRQVMAEGREDGGDASLKDVPDALGDQITRWINHHPAFSRPPWQKKSKRQSDSSTSEQQLTSWIYPPLLSRHNLLVLAKRIRQLTQLSWWKRQGQQLLQWPRQCARFLVHGPRPSWQGVVQVFLGIVIWLVLTMAISTQFALAWSLVALSLCLSYLTSLLFDWEEVQKLCPPAAIRLIHRLYDAWVWVDAYLLLGHRFAGREWNEDDFEWVDPIYAASREESLWDLPPPSIQNGRRLCLDPDFMARPEWSRDTVHHVVGIHFCYVMLREEHLRKQATKRRKQLEKSSSMSTLLLQEEVDFKLPPRRRNSACAVLGSDDERGNQGSVAGSEGDDHTASDLLEGDDSPNAKVTVISTDLRRSRRQPSCLSAGSPAEAIELKMSEGSSEGGHLAADLLSCSDGGSDLRAADDDIRSEASNATELAAADLPWIDVGAKIGIRLLNSAHVQRAMASHETADRLMGHFAANSEGGGAAGDPSPARPVDPTSSTDPTPASRLWTKPVHSMWTFPAAAGSSLSSDQLSDIDESSTTMGSASAAHPVLVRRHSHGQVPRPLSPPPVDGDRPPLSPARRRKLPSPRGRSASPKTSVKATQHSPTRKERWSPPILNRVKAVPTGSAGRSSRKAAAPLGWLGRPRHSDSEIYSSSTAREGVRSVRAPLKAGVKVAVPIFPYMPGRRLRKVSYEQYQMGTVVSSKRIYVGNVAGPSNRSTNCLSVTIKLDKCFLRNGEFAELTFRVMDDWAPKYMPRHSKVPIGACIATSYGIGVSVGWRVEDDAHVVRSLWQRRGSGAAHAYLNRDVVHGTVEAANGFRVETKFGWGIVVACVDGGRTFESVRYFVAIKEEGRHKGHVLELHRSEIMSCQSVQFIPVIEHIREAAHYQLQVDSYREAMQMDHQLDTKAPTLEQEFWRSWSSCLDILWNSFLKAVDEDKDFDDGVNEFMTSIINFLDRLDAPESEEAQDNGGSEKITLDTAADEVEVVHIPHDQVAATSSKEVEESQEPGFWIMNDLFGGIFRNSAKGPDTSNKGGKTEIYVSRQLSASEEAKKSKYYQRAYALIRILMKTVSIARAASVEYPHFRLALAISYDFLLFLRTIVKVQEKNVSVQSVKVWKRAWEEIVSTFGPIKDRLEKIGRGIAQRMEKQGRLAKIKVLKFVDTILSDERLLIALEHGEWHNCLVRLELALIKARIIEEENLVYYRKTARFIYDHLHMTMSNGGNAAATRNTEKLALLAKTVQSMASPRRAILKLLRHDDVLELFERILVRAYYKEDVVSRMLTIHASNFHTLRHLRMLKDFSVAGRLWIPLLDAADEEFSWVVSQMPENSKDMLCPLSSLFSLCVSQFHKINAGDLSKDWLAFLLEEDSVRIIQEIDMRLILAMESFSRDVREMMTVLPYYSSIDDDILNLMDEVDLDDFLKEASEAMDDEEKFNHFVREKATIAVERFLNYLPKMSIPVEKRELGEGWVLTCRGEDGGDLSLSDVHIRKENLVCQIMGGEALFFPMFGDDDLEGGNNGSSVGAQPAESTGGHIQESVLDSIRELLIQAQRYGCWKPGVGGVGLPPSDRYVAAVLNGLPVSAVLNCAIELWRNLEIDDDELLEIAIKDVSFQIQHQKQREEGCAVPEPRSPLARQPSDDSKSETRVFVETLFPSASSDKQANSFDTLRRRFNPRIDPTILFLEMKNLKLQLDNFLFRIEKNEKRTIFDPVFEGRGMVSLQNVSIRVRIECAKERVKKAIGIGTDGSAPILHLRELDVRLERVSLQVRDTGFGSDWILNRAVTVFEENITRVVEDNLRDQIYEQIKVALENLNSYFVVHPKILLDLLGISMEDLDENVVWV